MKAKRKIANENFVSPNIKKAFAAEKELSDF